ncbi:hypothetical protein JCM10207_001009 [Rhodosporidiobolus poonsookiae]
MDGQAHGAYQQHAYHPYNAPHEQQQQQQPPAFSQPQHQQHAQGMPAYANMFAHAPQHSFAPQQLADGLPPSRDSIAGPSRTSGTAAHRRDYSTGGAQGNGDSATATSRPAAGPYDRPVGGPHNVKASSTTSLFTTRRNWSQHILEELQDFMHVLSPTGAFIFASTSIKALSGYTPDELFARPIFDFIHPDDAPAFKRDLEMSMRTGDTLTLYYRFKNKDERYTLFEVTGHPYYGSDDKDKPNGRPAKCFFAMARPYPSKNQAMLDSFLELKFENERLRQELLVMYKEVEGDAPSGGFPYGQSGLYRSDSFDPARSVIDPATGLVQTQTLIPSTSNTYGALGIGISANGTKGDGTGDKKKKKARVEEGEFVCRDCGTVDSPEWRKGPEGPKSLCNACGLRYAKLVSKSKKEQKEAAARRA